MLCMLDDDLFQTIVYKEGLVPCLTSQARTSVTCEVRGHPPSISPRPFQLSLTHAHITTVMAAVSSLVAAPVAGALSGARVTGRRSAVRDIPRKQIPSTRGVMSCLLSFLSFSPRFFSLSDARVRTDAFARALPRHPRLGVLPYRCVR